ncbi:galactose oxidase [Gigaspora margarita]|uniref:Galactose oxidase n=1 Tax=Gigaspora margarita TaxID=4874 RepID=A0A8H4AZS6_GIGMA|nr:galactose oxidase [Gigaspora margarita]
MNFITNFQSFLLTIILLFPFVSFNTATPPWNKDIEMPIGYAFGASCVSPIDNSVFLVDTTSMTWSTLAISTNAPPPLSLYTATLLSTGIIVYFGGTKTRSDNTEEPVSMYEIQTFNAKNHNWSTKVAGGDDIGTRAYHSAVLTTPYIAKLNTSSWMWSIPNLSQINSPQLSYHSAASYGDYMIIAFGNYCIMSNPSKTSISFISLSNNLYILDIKSYTWVSSFNPNHSTSNQTFPPNKLTTNQTPSSDNNLNNYWFIGIGIVLFGVFSVVGFLLYKRKRKNQYSKFIPTPDTTDRI